MVSLTQTLPKPRQAGDEPSVASLIQQDLNSAGYPGFRKLRSSITEGVFVLQGCVSSFYHKQIAQTLARRRLQPQVVIDNQIRVESQRGK